MKINKIQQIQLSVEFHDSNLSKIHIENNTLLLDLSPAYVHKWELINQKWIGSGCLQDATITIEQISSYQKRASFPVKIVDGMITVAGNTFDNLVPAPCKIKGTSHMKLNLDSGEILEISGGSFSIELKGEAKYIEKLPDNWHPK